MSDAQPGSTLMMDALLAAGQRLAEALHAENEALAALDLTRAAALTAAKMQAADAFAAAYAAAAKTGARAVGGQRQSTAAMTSRLESLGAENRRLLERAISIQSRVIETIAGAALPKPGVGYASLGRPQAARATPALALATRA